MPRKRKGNLSHSSKKARAMTVARRAETSRQAELRRLEQAERQAALRAAETSEQTRLRLQQHAEYLASQRAAETAEQSLTRRQEQADRQANLRVAENMEETEARRIANSERMAVRRQAFTQNTWGVFEKVTFEYDATIDYGNHRIIQMGRMDKECKFCRALTWKEKRAGMCCSGGKVSIPCIEEPVEPLKTLFSYKTEESRRFLNQIRKYNSCFHMTSFGADRIIAMPGFSPTFTIRGKVYHRIGSLFPSANQLPQFLQVYFMGDEEAQTDRRYQIMQGVQRETVAKIQRVLHDHNRLIHTFKTALESMPNENYKVVIHADRTPQGQHERRYNAPTVNEVAAVIAGNEFLTRDIAVHALDGNLARVLDTHKFYDALEYPLIFWKGQESYNFEISQINPSTRQPVRNKKVSLHGLLRFSLNATKERF